MGAAPDSLLFYGYLLMARFVRIASLAEIGDEIEHRLRDTHILPRVILWKVWRTQHQRQSENVRNVLPSHRAQPLLLVSVIKGKQSRETGTFK